MGNECGCEGRWEKFWGLAVFSPGPPKFNPPQNGEKIGEKRGD